MLTTAQRSGFARYGRFSTQTLYRPRLPPLQIIAASSGIDDRLLIRSELLELCREVPQKLRCFHYFHTTHSCAPLPDKTYRLQYVVHVALCVDATWYSKPHQFLVGGFFFATVRVKSEHDGADFDGTNACFNIQLNR